MFPVRNTSTGLWWVDLGWLEGVYPAAISLPLFCRAGVASKKEKLVNKDKDRETAR